MTEVLFYHLLDRPPESALPSLLERCLERDWQVVIQAGTEPRRDAINEHLWTYKPDSFLPHSAEGSAVGEPADNPIWVTTTTENPNKAQVRFVVDDASPGPIEAYHRVIYMFDGRDEDAVAGARERWKIEKDAGHDLTYWQQDDEGRWVKKA